MVHVIGILQKGDTALHVAVRGRNKRITEIMLRNPKDSRLLYRHNKNGETPYQLDAAHTKSILNQIFGASKCMIYVYNYVLIYLDIYTNIRFITLHF